MGELSKEIRKLQEGPKGKEGIGGRDNFIINLPDGDGHQGHLVTLLQVGRHLDGIQFLYRNQSFVVPVLAFNALNEWLNSWGYLE